MQFSGQHFPVSGKKTEIYFACKGHKLNVQEIRVIYVQFMFCVIYLLVL